MSEVVYINLYGKIKEYLDKIQEVSVPDKITYKWLESLGFKSKNDRPILKILRAMNFVDSSKVPAERWQRFKNPQIAPLVLAEGIRDAYSDLFQTYEDAYRKDREALYAYFSTKTGKAKSTVNLMVSTFTALCELANFEEKVPEFKPKAPSEVQVVPLPEAVRPLREERIPEIHINVQLHLPPTNDVSVYDNLFKSLKKHLLSGKE